MDIGLGSVLSGALGFLGNVFNWGSQSKENSKNRQFTREMYELQRDDSIKFWQMNNDFNDPSRQLERITSAGLNPNLMYGQGTVGNASAPVSTPTPQRYEGKAPQVDPNMLSQLATLGFEKWRAEKELKIAQQNADTSQFEAQTNRIDVENSAPVKGSQTDVNKTVAMLNQWKIDYNKKIEGFMEQQERYAARKAVADYDLAEFNSELAREGVKHAKLDNEIFAKYGMSVASATLDKLTAEIFKAQAEATYQLALSDVARETIVKLGIEEEDLYDLMKSRQVHDGIDFYNAVRDRYGSNTATVLSNIITLKDDTSPVGTAQDAMNVMSTFRNRKGGSSMSVRPRKTPMDYSGFVNRKK